MTSVNKTLSMLMMVGLIAVLPGKGAGQEDEGAKAKESVNREMLELVRDLRREVEALRKEVREMKAGGEDSRAPKGRADRDRADRDRADRERAESRPRGDRGDSLTPRDRPRPRDRDMKRDRPRAEVPPGGEGYGRRRPAVNKADLERKTKRIFAAYDKNEDEKVSFKEWIAMKEGEVRGERLEREKKLFRKVDKDENESVSLREFFAYQAEKSGSREDAVRERRRDGDRERGDLERENRERGDRERGDRKGGDRERAELERGERENREREGDRKKEDGDRR